MNILADELMKVFEEVQPMEFYREIFPIGELDEWRENPVDREGHAYTGIAMEITKEKKANGKPRVKRYTVTDDLDIIDELIWSENFCVLAPISYVGKERKSENARFMYALVVELDNLIVEKNGYQDGLHRLMAQWTDRVHWIPCPTFTVASGTGLHLYYQFEKPIPLFPNIVKELAAYKRELTTMIWNRHVTTSHTPETIQQESIFQAFRMVGTLTKKGDRVRAFRTGDRVSIEYMNSYLLERSKSCAITTVYKSRLTKEAAKKKYPEWYERRVERGEPKGRWVCKRDLYDWWKRRITAEAKVGHRYYCLMMLAIYAVKCEISREELEADCFELMEVFEAQTDSETNHFTEKDVLDALQSFEDRGLVTYPVTSISNRSGIPIEKNKRNGRKQKVHLRIARSTLEIMNEDEGRTLQGRPKGSGTAESRVRDYRAEHPEASVTEVARALGISRTTVYKWWEGSHNSK